MIGSISPMSYANYASYGSIRSGATEGSNTNLSSGVSELSSSQSAAGASTNALKAANEMGSEVLKLLGNTLDIKA